MKILIDGSTAREGGGLTYLRYLLPALCRQNREDEIYLLVSSRYQMGLINLVPDEVYPVPCSLSPYPLLRYLQLCYWIPKLVKNLGIDLLFSVSELTVPGSACPLVVLVRNQKLFLSADELTSFGDRLRLGWRQLPVRLLVLHTLHKASGVAFVSNSFRDYVVERLGIDPDKTRVIYHGCADFFRPSERDYSQSCQSKDPYMLVVANVTFHKNLLVAIKGFATYLEGAPESKLRMRIAGSVADPRLYKALIRECVRVGIEDRVEFLGKISHRDLAPLYARARIFLFPSSMESFGHPLLEALSCGVPAIVSDLPVFREIAGDTAEYFPTHRPDLLAEKIWILLNNPELCDRRRSLGVARASQFTWDETAVRLRQLFQEAAGTVSKSALRKGETTEQQVSG